MSFLYAKSDAAGANDGTSWADAYTNLQTALTAMGTGDTLYTDAPEAVPFVGGFSRSGINDFTVVTDAGPNGETWITNKRTATWTDAGGGVFSLVLAAEPAGVVYDFKRDDLVGTVTGVDLTLPGVTRAIAKYKSRRPLNINDLRAWYGFLRDGGATTTPSEGEWGYTGGVLYINPPGSPDLATVNSLAAYCPNGVDGISYGSCSNYTHRGRLIGLCYPGISGNAGYIVEGLSSTGGTIEGVIGIASGYHTAGFNSFSGSNNTLKDCLSVGMADANGNGLQQPWVFFSDSTSSGHVGTGLAMVVTGLLDTSGSPLFTDFSPSPLYSHTSGSPETISVDWFDILSLDFHEQLEAKHAITLGGSGNLGGAGNVPTISDRLDPDTYTCSINRAITWGNSALPANSMVHDQCIFDRGDVDSDGVNGPGYVKLLSSFALKRSLVITGAFTVAWVRGNSSTEQIVFDNTTFIEDNILNANRGSSILALASSGLNCIKLQNGCRFLTRGGNSSGQVVRVTFPDVWTQNFRGLLSDGTNEFASGEFSTNTLLHNNSAVTPRNSTWWQANIVDGSTDDFVADLDVAAIEAAYFAVSVGLLQPPTSPFDTRPNPKRNRAYDVVDRVDVNQTPLPSQPKPPHKPVYFAGDDPYNDIPSQPFFRNNV